MKTYRVNFKPSTIFGSMFDTDPLRDVGQWQNYLSDDGTPMEFLFLDHARTFIRLANIEVGSPSIEDDFQIVDSTGERYPAE